MITRQEYMADSAKLFDAYWLQFATPATYNLVRSAIGIDAIKASSDPSFNDIPLARWDRLDGALMATIDTKLKGAAEGFEAGRFGWALNDCVCIAKVVARRIKEQEATDAR